MILVGPNSVLRPPQAVDLYVVRGDVLDIVMGFQNVPEVVENTAAYRLRMGVRRRQSDTLPFILQRDAVFDVEPTDVFEGVPLDLVATVTFSPSETQTLPVEGAVYLIEWTDAVGGSNRRLLQGRLIVGD